MDKRNGIARASIPPSIPATPTPMWYLCAPRIKEDMLISAFRSNIDRSVGCEKAAFNCAYTCVSKWIHNDNECVVHWHIKANMSSLPTKNPRQVLFLNISWVCITQGITMTGKMHCMWLYRKGPCTKAKLQGYESWPGLADSKFKTKQCPCYHYDYRQLTSYQRNFNLDTYIAVNVAFSGHTHSNMM